jgi:GH24 family phage-related lysozyme (muramidase)
MIKPSSADAKSLTDLSIAHLGIRFIQTVESNVVSYYDDAQGDCTVGTGHLVKKQSCSNLGLKRRRRREYDIFLYGTYHYAF